ncbi:MAG: FKBP-type peptidyl-prolyl cis-trans isomerase [Spirochaetaceae bacterium]|jgi:FKBP-type peptidyl-prolyl cis-trans isomerase FkpA|nr:FKBP-type peptidyl-prolyl cis-trans isomerase [Spirochaetaceae bacterium]
MVKRCCIAALLSATLLIACNAQNASTGAAPGGGDENTSYAFGFVIGSDLRQLGLEFDYDAFTRGFKDSVEDLNKELSMEEAIATIQQAFTDASRAKESAFFAENGQKEGVITTASGLQYEVVTEGSGVKPGAEDTVSVNYEGTLVDGTVFDSSYTRGEPAEFPLNMVIPGWSEGLMLMSVGSTYRLYIPSDLAYGPQGSPGAIPPYATLIFDVELLSIKPQEAP